MLRKAWRLKSMMLLVSRLSYKEPVWPAANSCACLGQMQAVAVSFAIVVR